MSGQAVTIAAARPSSGGGRFARLRKTAGLSQERLAHELGVARKTVFRWEHGLSVPYPRHWPKLARLLRVTHPDLEELFGDGSLGMGSDEALAPRLLAPVTSECSLVAGGALVEAPAAIFDRIGEGAIGLDDAVADVLDLYVAEVVERYEAEGPRALAPEAVQQRRLAQRFLTNSSPSQRALLLAVAGRLSGLLSYMAVNLGRFSSARAYALDAFALADEVGDDELKAWVRGTQSLAEYYAGNYDSALNFARDGLRYAGRGRQAVRLLVNGEARALGKLGDVAGVDRAVGRSYELLRSFPAADGMTPCISFGIYSEARVASNAATAYLSAGETAKVLEHGDRAQAVVDRSPSIWSRALVRLDTASAFVKSEQPDFDQAMTLAREAMSVSFGHDIESIRQRTGDLARDLQAQADTVRFTGFAEEVHAWMATTAAGSTLTTV